MKTPAKHTHIINVRLKDARIANGYTAKEVAKSISISPQALSLYELGKSTPPPEIFNKLVVKYGLPVSFYYKPGFDNSMDGTIYFRKFTAATKAKRNEAQIFSKWFVHDIIAELNKMIKLPAVDPLFDRIKTSVHIDLDNFDYETMAKIIRREWGLGNEPLNDLMYEFEKRGIVICILDLDDDIDGFSYWSAGRPFMFLNARNNFFRLRMSMAHELCHLFFHGAVEDIKHDLKKIENDAKNFAGAFLLPDVTCQKYFNSISLQELQYLKPQLKISITGMLKRCEQLGFISEERTVSLNNQISAKRWRKVEPLDNIFPPERPVLAKQSVELIINNNILSKPQLSNLFALPTDFIEYVCNLSKGYFSTSKILPIFI